MGDYFQIIVDPEVSEDEAPNLAQRVHDWLVERQIIQPGPSDGECLPGPGYASTLEKPQSREAYGQLDIKVGRTVFYSIGDELTCRACQARFQTTEGPWIEAVDAWYEGDDAVTFACPRCGAPELLNRWDGEFPWGFGNLGLQFMNWTSLSKQFVSDVTKLLGHRTVLVRYKL